jgi:hypothetical protein
MACDAFTWVAPRPRRPSIQTHWYDRHMAGAEGNECDVATIANRD